MNDDTAAMTDDRGATAIGHLRGDDVTDDWRYVPRAMRPVWARGLLAALVIVSAAALVMTFALPSFG